MAAKRGSSSKGKTSSGGSRKGGGSRQQAGGGVGGFLTKVVLYPLAIAGGLYMGVQAHAVYGNDPLPLPLPIPWPETDKRPLPKARPAAARQGRRAEGEWPRSRSARRAEEKSRRKTEEPRPEETDPTPPGEKTKAETASGRDESKLPQAVAPAGAAASAGRWSAAEPEDPVTIRPVTPERPATVRKAAPVPAVEIDRGIGERREVALTFDAGADYRPAAQILDTLAAEGIRCTFFLTGEWVQRNPKTSRRIASEGHEVGNHSWDHPPFTQLSTAEIQDQLRRTESIIRETTGRTSRPYFRPPLGARDNRVRQIVGSEGYLTVYWTLDSRDSVDRGITAAQIRDRVLGKIGPGSIVLMHCGSQATADALPEILKGLKSRGLIPVPVSRLLAE